MKKKKNINRRMIYGLFFMICFSFFACSEHESFPSESDRLICKSIVERNSMVSRAMSDQIKDINFYYLKNGETVNYTQYPISLSDDDWLNEYFLFKTNKWRQDINCGAIGDTVYYYMIANNESGNEYVGNPNGIEPLQGVSAMCGDPIAEFYLKCREAKLTTIVKMSDNTKQLDLSLLSLTLNAFPEKVGIRDDYSSPAIIADKNKPLVSYPLINKASTSQMKSSISQTILLPEQNFDLTADIAHRPTILMEYKDTKYNVYLDTIKIERSLTNPYRREYDDKFAFLHNEHITLTLTLTPIIELIVSVTLDDWQIGKSFDPIAVEPK